MSSPGTAGPGPSAAASSFYLHGTTVGFGEAIRQAFRHGFTYRGRASRSAYWWFVLFQVIFLAALVVFAIVAGEVTGGPARVAGITVGVTLIVVITYLFVFYLSLVSLALLVRRLHDTGKSGWWVCIGFLPLAGPLVLLIFTTLEGEPALNRYDQF